MRVLYADARDQPLTGPIEVVHNTGFKLFGEWRRAREAEGWRVWRVGPRTVILRTHIQGGARYVLRRENEMVRVLIWYEDDEENEEEEEEA